jgi:DNA-binding transcriptional regulator YiaG
VITGLVFRRSLADRRDEWPGVRSMNALRQLRRDADLTQHAFAELLDVPVNTFRMWDSGLRPVPARMLLQAQAQSNVTRAKRNC